MSDNQLKKSVYLLGWIMGSLFLLSFVGEFQIGDVTFKKVNILADVHPDPPKVATRKDSAKIEIKKPLVKLDSCPTGITCIEDFSDHKNTLQKFFRALGDSRRRSVRIAFFGDSFTEGDILCASFRDTLQQLYGGRGVGYVPITSLVTSFRTTVRHSFSGWKTYWAVGDKSPNAPLGMPGYCFIPEESNEVEYKPGSRWNNKFHSMKLFYVSPLESSLKYVVNDTASFELPLESSDTLQRAVIECAGAQAIKLHFEPVDSLRLYGVSFEEDAGLYVDNLAMRGNSGMGLLQIGSKELLEFNHYQNYKLILLQFGLNVVTESDSSGYTWYADRMVRVVNRLKENFPDCSILLISVSDRSYNQDGTFVTIPGIVDMRDVQRDIARRTKIAFWDLYTAMGGENSMVKFVTAIPPLAGKDYTHVNFRGGQRIAKKLADAILYERTKNVPKNKKKS